MPARQELQSRPDEFETAVCVTGQHREMLDQVLGVFGVVPDHDLHVMKPGQTLFDVTCDVLLRIKPVLEEEQPDCVLVHGDTSTSFAAALASFYLQIPVGTWRRACARGTSRAPGRRSSTARLWTWCRDGTSLLRR